MRICHFSRGFEDYVIGLANELVDFAGVHLVLAGADEWMADHLSAGVRIHYSGGRRVADPRNAIAALGMARLLRRLKPDLVHFQNGVVWEAGASLLNPGVPVVTTIHDVTTHPREFQLRMAPQALLDVLPRRSAGIIVHGERLATNARDHFGFVGESPIVRAMSHPIITRYGVGSARPQASGRVLFFGTLDRYKGVETLLEAMPLVLQAVEGAELRICGRTTRPSYYRSLSPPGVRVDWDLRFQDSADVRNAFAWADVVVLPYIEASQSGVLYLATSFGVPVVATRVGSLSEVVISGVNGLLAAPGDPISLAESLVRLLTDIGLRARIIDAIVAERDRVLSTKVVGQATVKLYEDVVDVWSKRNC